MPKVFLVVCALSAWLTFNTLVPIRWPYMAVPSFFAAWLAGELAPQRLVAMAAIVVGFAWAGAIRGWEGAAGVALLVLSAAGSVAVIRNSFRARETIEAALRGGLGDDYQDRIDPELMAGRDPGLRWRMLITPLLMRHPKVEVIKGIQYHGKGRRHRLDVYRHKSHPTGCPVLFQIHGGGWVIGNKNQQAKPLMLQLAAHGWVCVATNYRLSPKATFPDHLIDLKRALRWVKENVAEYGGDPEFIVATGGSAGGHLSSLVALTPNDPEYQPGFEDDDTTVQACVPYYGVYDFTNRHGEAMTAHTLMFLERAVMKRSIKKDPDAFRRASPLDRVTSAVPPFFVIHGSLDTLVPISGARHFVDRLREESRQPVCYAELPGAEHAFEVLPSIRTIYVVAGAERFLDYIYSAHLAAQGEDAPDEMKAAAVSSEEAS